MTLEEALNLVDTCIAITCMHAPGYEGTSHLLFNAIIEEWLDGNINSASASTVQKHIDKYGANMYKQAARIIANKTEIYGDVE